MGRPEAEDGFHVGLVRVLGLEDVLVTDARAHQVDQEGPVPVLALWIEADQGLEFLVHGAGAEEGKRVWLPPVRVSRVLDAQSLSGHVDVEGPRSLLLEVGGEPHHQRAELPHGGRGYRLRQIDHQRRTRHAGSLDE
jgi:hypothetical protein